MEHLLPHNARPPFRVPYTCPPKDSEAPTTDEYQALFVEVRALQSRGASATMQEHYEIWLKHCRGPRMVHLCFALLNKFFFGQLGCLFGEEANPGMVEDFCLFEGEDVYLTTASLPWHLSEWQRYIRNVLQGESEEERKIRINTIRAMLESNAIVLRHLSWFLDYTYSDLMSAVRPKMQQRTDEPLGMAHFACVVLHQALVQACGRVLGIEVRAGNALSLRSELPWLKRRMQIEGWCPYTIWKLYSVSNVDELVYGYCLGTKRLQQDHSRCSEAVCAANNVVNQDSPMHVPGEGNGDCMDVHAPVLKMLPIMADGGVPVLQINKAENGRLSLVAHKLGDEHAEYVAISHAWVDGLGCTTMNSIAHCQLERIANRIAALQLTEKHVTLCIWMDTLCVPVNHTFSHLRDLQVQRMHQIYKNAYAVMVLDGDTLTLHPDAPFEEIGMRLYMSAWSSRLWTYQEGSLNRRLLVMNKESYIDLDFRINQARDHEYADTTQMALSHNLIDGMLRWAVFSLGRACFHVPTEGSLDAQHAIHAIRDRTSSRPDSEAIIIGSALGLDVKSILEAPPEERMATLIGAMPRVAANMLFSPGPRLTTPGLRWSPRSVIRSQGGYAANPLRLKMSPDRGEVNVQPICELDREGRGLLISLPAVRLRQMNRPPRGLGRKTISFEMLGRHYAFNGLDAEFDGKDKNALCTKEIITMLDRGKNMVIILPESDFSYRLYTGALVEVLEETEERTLVCAQEFTQVKFIMLVNFNANSESVGNLDLVSTAGPNDASTSRSSEPGSWCGGEWLEPRVWLVD
ncbi:hypothetical protein LTR22_020467 [Elasticomyces elasticus]|nr:hypothetical protein LTR22_020467 [Elasticomyces elasticus]KAK4917820.1 hypothetical protein LTR49_014357 [Elasticomyces elasticus]KAK5750492.1 hypothetical protein LTS12_019450 [Elasticomyces elasticus]